LRQLTTESLLLAFLGAALGVATVYASLPSLMAVAPIEFPSYMSPQIDWRVTAFAVALSSAIGLLLGLAPAVHVRTGVHGLLKRTPGRSGGTPTSRRLRDLLVITEIACATLLVIGAGLFIRSMNALASVEPGYDPSGVLTLRVTFPDVEVAADGAAPSTNPPNPGTALSLGHVLERLAATPGIDAVAAGTDVPMTGSSAIPYTAEGQPPVTAEDRPRGYRHFVTPGFFETLAVPLLAGRTFTQAELQWDGVSGTAVIVTERLVNRFWPGQDPIGKRIKRGGTDSDAPWWHVVGVVSDLKYRGIPDNPTADPDIFLPYSAVSGQGTLFLLVRTALDPSATVPLVREAIYEVDRNTLISEVAGLETLVARRTAFPRLVGWLLGVFGATASMLAAIGIYGVMSYAVARRRKEVGLRVALGAHRLDILGMFARSGAWQIVMGLTLGMVAALGLARLVAELLYQVEPADPVTFITTAAGLASVAFAACLIPSIRASRAAPATALREE
jgi:putative ABC transport system permease protein